MISWWKGCGYAFVLYNGWYGSNMLSSLATICDMWLNAWPFHFHHCRRMSHPSWMKLPLAVLLWPTYCIQYDHISAVLRCLSYFDPPVAMLIELAAPQMHHASPLAIRVFCTINAAVVNISTPSTLIWTNNILQSATPNHKTHDNQIAASSTTLIGPAWAETAWCHWWVIRMGSSG